MSFTSGVEAPRNVSVETLGWYHDVEFNIPDGVPVRFIFLELHCWFQLPLLPFADRHNPQAENTFVELPGALNIARWNRKVPHPSNFHFLGHETLPPTTLSGMPDMHLFRR